MATPIKPLFDDEEFVRVPAAVRFLKCGERWLRDGVNRGGFPHHRMGGLLVFSRQDLAEIADMHRHPARRAKRRSSSRRSTPPGKATKNT